MNISFRSNYVLVFIFTNYIYAFFYNIVNIFYFFAVHQLKNNLVRHIFRHPLNQICYPEFHSAALFRHLYSRIQQVNPYHRLENSTFE